MWGYKGYQQHIHAMKNVCRTVINALASLVLRCVWDNYGTITGASYMKVSEAVGYHHQWCRFFPFVMLHMSLVQWYHHSAQYTGCIPLWKCECGIEQNHTTFNVNWESLTFDSTIKFLEVLPFLLTVLLHYQLHHMANWIGSCILLCHLVC